MRDALLIIYFALFGTVACLECLYYRVRADESLTPEKMMRRNCSSTATSCLKIISRNELAQQEQIDAPPTIEGRCAFTAHECADRIGQCISEPPMTRFGVTIHERKCCSSEDLSNSVGGRNLLVRLITILVVSVNLL
ncbi:unnamed protein product [Nippostrongylus brasiliensis]|uniref:UPAR/Ly6 domain-containing protein n=1 Tax=Nippostrongylus brasiliensis TaxID=27835 RepID=A0A0N4Y2G2_NIPBR|nr:unnamed protein product [Nippostrongylus brasiliensis]